MTWCFIFLIFLSICRSCNFSLSKCFVFWVYAGLRDLRFTKPTYTQKNQHFDAKSAKNLHILKKIKSFDSEKSPNLHILKKIKKIKNLRLYVGLTGIDDLVFDFLDFFEYMQVWWLFTIKTFVFFEYMQVWWLFPIKMFDFFEYMQVWGTWGSPNLHILKKSNILMPKMHKACIYSKISKVLIVKSHQTCIYSKKSKKSKISDSMWDSLV